jgi:hypothetical protein
MALAGKQASHRRKTKPKNIPILLVTKGESFLGYQEINWLQKTEDADTLLKSPGLKINPHH